MSTLSTLLDLLDAASQQTDPTRGYTFVNGTQAHVLPFGELRRNAEQTAGLLQQMGVRKGDTVLLVIPSSPEFASIYWALQLCGAAPCILPSPAGTGDEVEGAQRIRSVGKQMDAQFLITTDNEAASWAPQANPFRVVPTSALVNGDQAIRSTSWHPVEVCGTDVALIQATSGSTGTPKCVVLTHQQVVANLNQIGERLQVHDQDVVCSWLPLFHDMGLVGCFLFTMRWQLQGVFMTPYRFLRRPVDWLRAISRYGGTLSPAPNFAYALTTERVREADLAELDLSTWRSAMCGAEPIDVRVLHRFAARFASCGFRDSALTPCYGMAEAALAVTIQSPGQPLLFETILRSQLVMEKRVERFTGPEGVVGDEDGAGHGVDDRLQVCACGQAMQGTEIQIRAADGRILPDEYLGEIWIATPSLMREYHGQTDATQAALQHGWFNTGDLGYLRNGQLYVTGRAKELIIIRGHNYLPTDVEWAASEMDGVTAGRVAAFGNYDAASGTEQLVVVCEQPQRFNGRVEDLVAAMKSHIGKRIGLLPSHIRMVPRNSIPRTTSGKLQRTLTKRLYLNSWSKWAEESGGPSPQFA